MEHKANKGGIIKSWIKNALILGLAALCVIQTRDLWFNGIANVNPFSIWSFWESERVVQVRDTIKKLAVPRRMFYNGSDGEYSCKYTGIENTPQFKAAIDMIAKALLTGQRPDEGFSLDWPECLAEGAAILDYGFPMPASAFTMALGIGAESLKDIPNFDMAAIIPQTDGTVVIFADSLAENLADNSADNSNEKNNYLSVYVPEKLPESTSPAAAQDTVLKYSPVYLPDGESGSLVFLPLSAPDRLDYYSILAVGPFDGRTINDRNMAELVGVWFEDASGFRSAYAEELHTFSDEYTVVRYKDKAFLEYSSWMAGKWDLSSFESAYAEAVYFIDEDEEVSNEYSLSGYTHDGDEYTFYFDYAINDLPVRLNRSLKTELDLESAIEVTVAKDRVSRYRRYANSFENISSQPVKRSLEESFGLNRIRQVGINENLYYLIHGLELAYDAKPDTRPALSLAVEYGQAEIVINVGE